MEINGRKTNTELLVTGLGKERIILGFPWLNEQNPNINWKTGEFSWRDPPKRRFLNITRRKDTRKQEEPLPKPSIEEILDEEDWKNNTVNPIDDNTDILISFINEESEDNIWINSKSTTATAIQAEINLKKKILPVEEQVPKEFHEFLDIFSKEKAARFPEPRPWDHKIEMKDTFIPKSFKTYNLTQLEQIELDKFLKENLDKGYIRPSTKKTENLDHARIIDISMNIRSKTPIPYPLSVNSWTNSKERNISPNEYSPNYATTICF